MLVSLTASCGSRRRSGLDDRLSRLSRLRPRGRPSGGRLSRLRFLRPSDSLRGLRNNSWLKSLRWGWKERRHRHRDLSNVSGSIVNFGGENGSGGAISVRYRIHDRWSHRCQSHGCQCPSHGCWSHGNCDFLAGGIVFLTGRFKRKVIVLVGCTLICGSGAGGGSLGSGGGCLGIGDDVDT